MLRRLQISIGLKEGHTTGNVCDDREVYTEEIVVRREKCKDQMKVLYRKAWPSLEGPFRVEML